MAEITKKRISEILRIAFDLLWFEPDGLYLREILEHMRKNYDFADEELGSFAFAPQFPRYEVIIRVGSIPLARAGWLVKTGKGKWQITEKGRQESRRYSNAEDFFLSAVQEYEEWKDRESARRERFDFLVVDRAEERAREQIRRFLQSMSLPELRILVGDLLRGLGYYVIWTAPPEQQNGQIHIIASSNPIGIGGGRIMVHINQTGQAASIEGLQSFLSTVRGPDHGVYISLYGFNSPARQEGYVGTHGNVRLIDLDEFIELWLGNLKKLSPEARKRFPLKPVYFLEPPET
jgi:restriction system protein